VAESGLPLEFAPALVAADGADLWIYLAGPAVGALAGAAVYAFLHAGNAVIPIEQELRA
jgi:glycerol uptake facilitator-like aquaporin